MIYYFLYPLRTWISAFNVFGYITFRAAMAMVTALVVTLVVGPWWIQWLRKRQFGQQVRDDGPETHKKKQGTPTMGGLMMLASIFVSAFLWADLGNLFVWLVIGVMGAYGLVGLADDFLKISAKNPKGLPGRYKLAGQVIGGGLLLGLLIWRANFDGQIDVPLFKDLSPNLGWLFIPFALTVLVGTSNAVNLTDGLDGLVTGPMAIVAGTFGLFAYAAGHAKISHYLQLISVPGAGELAVLCGAIVGACLGFLWFNTYPAQVFMGDVGALALGGAIGMIAVITKQELLLAIVGGIFVIEALSVMAQVISFKTRGRRIFKMAPIHHHFELKGWAEPQVIVRFWIIQILLAMIALSTLKLR